MTCSILWFNSKMQRVETKIWEGENAYKEAIKWAKENLENYQADIIQLIY